MVALMIFKSFEGFFKLILEDHFQSIWTSHLRLNFMVILSLINGCYNLWYIMRDFTLEHPHLWVFFFIVNFSPLVSYVRANLALYVFFEFNFILILGIRKSVSLVGWYMTHSFGLHHLFFKLMIFRFYWFLETWIILENLNLMG